MVPQVRAMTAPTPPSDLAALAEELRDCVNAVWNGEERHHARTLMGQAADALDAAEQRERERVSAPARTFLPETPAEAPAKCERCSGSGNVIIGDVAGLPISSRCPVCHGSGETPTDPDISAAERFLGEK